MAVKKKASYVIKGMQRDLSVSKFNPDFAYENMNIRITARESNNLLSITNEKGNKQMHISSADGSDLKIEGKYVGSNILNNIITIFTTDSDNDRIYRLIYDHSNKTFRGDLLFKGELNLDINYPIETLSVYENEAIQKVYWVDGVNQPRVINVSPVLSSVTFTDNSFEFAQNIKLDDEISITKNTSTTGIFAPGTIQYAFSYFNKYGQETNIFYTSPLNYISYQDRGASPEDKVSNSFVIRMNKLDTQFQYIRIYSIHRTSIDATPTVKRVTDVAVNSKFDLTETNSQVVSSHTFPDNSVDNMSIYEDGLLIPISTYPSITYTSNETLLTYKEYNIRFGGNTRLIFKSTLSDQFSTSIQSTGEDIIKIRLSGTESGWQNVTVTPTNQELIKSDYTLTTSSTGFGQYVDSGTSGDIIDPTELLYKGSESITASTLAQKDNTLFLGDIKLKRNIIPDSVKDGLKDAGFYFGNHFKGTTTPPASGYYPYKNTLQDNSSDIKTFKYLEWYRIGIQFQHTTGKWSEAVWIKDEYNTTPMSTKLEGNSAISPVVGWYTINNDLVNDLIAQGYVRARGIVSYPSVSDREVIAQGVLMPTVYNVEDRATNSPFVMSSWFTRTNAPFDPYRSFEKVTVNGTKVMDWVDRMNGSYPSINSRMGYWAGPHNAHEDMQSHFDSFKVGSHPEFRHNHPIPDNMTRRAEIQCISTPPEANLDATTPAQLKHEFVEQNKEYFYIDQSILTFHSPEIQFDDGVKNIDTSNLRMRIVGMVPITSNATDINITTSTPQVNVDKIGFYKDQAGAENISVVGDAGIVSGIYWMDGLAKPKTDAYKNKMVGYNVYPWHRNGSLSNYGVPEGDEKRPAMLEQKILSNSRFSFNTLYYNHGSIWKAYEDDSATKTGISGVSIFNSNEQTMVKIPAPHNSDMGALSYYGNVDKIVNITKVGDRYNGYRIAISGYTDSESNSSSGKLFKDSLRTINSDESGDVRGTEPCHIKYKSTPHAVLALNYAVTGAARILPTIYDVQNGQMYPVNLISSGSKHMFWDTHGRSVSQDVINSIKVYPNSENISHGFLWLAELYNEQVVNRFGGDTQESLENNIWLPAGEPVRLHPNGNNVVKYTEGDTFYQRYDCLKTYPYTKEDQNSIVDIVSFMCETRVNIDGRYDRNRGQINNLHVSPQNFNLLNPVYTQSNNFFNYRTLNRNKLQLDSFNNAITWTKTKTLGEFTDTWTNLTLASTLDLDGDKGPLNAIRRYNNDLYAFQDRAISKILFNSRVQINASDGIPIEISNSYKVDGKVYITQDIGCKNKFSIVTTPNGLYFVDDFNSAIYKFSDGFRNITDELGFKTLLNDLSTMSEWNSESFIPLIAQADVNNGDVYFINKGVSFAYSEMLGQFTSFYNYEGVPLMFNAGKDFFAYKNGRMWHQFEGEYNRFFNVRKPYYITFVANPEPTQDKIFDTLEFRADSWQGNKLLNGVTFDNLEIWTEYQKGCSLLFNNVGKPSSLKKKFRVWRANIPRDNINYRDRIRNTWSYIKLSMNNPVNYKTELHDLMLYYFV